MTTPIEVAILGAGNIGKVHLQSALVMDDVTVRAVADAVPENRQDVRDWGVSAVYDDYEALLATEDVDVAVIAMPPSLHAPALEAAAEHGCDVFVEKPFARSVAEAREMLQIADDAGIRVGVDHTIRYLPEVRRIAEAYREGSIGHAPFAHVSRVNTGPFGQPPIEEPLPEWQLDPDASGGGVLLDLGLHLFDVLEWLFGDLRIDAATMGRQLEIPFEDAATVVMQGVECDTTVVMHCGSYQWEDPDDMNFQLRIEGVAGTLDSRSYAPDNFYAHAATSAAKNVWRRFTGEDPSYFEPTYYLQAHYAALSEFLEAIARGDAPPVDGRRGLRTLELAEEAYEAAGFDLHATPEEA